MVLRAASTCGAAVDLIEQIPHTEGSTGASVARRNLGRGRAAPRSSAPTRLAVRIADRERTVPGDWDQDCLCASLLSRVRTGCEASRARQELIDGVRLHCQSPSHSVRLPGPVARAHKPEHPGMGSRGVLVLMRLRRPGWRYSIMERS